MPHNLKELYSELKIDPDHSSSADVDKLAQWVMANLSTDLVIASNDDVVKFANYGKALSVFFENRNFSTLDKSF